MQLESMYQEIILDHYRHPHGRGLREPYDAEVHHVNPTCGDEVTLRVRLAEGVVAEVSHDGQGCSISQASTSVMTDLVTGRTLTEALAAGEEFLRLMQGKGAYEPDEDDVDALVDGVRRAQDFFGVA
jgi:nitrogen fixation NifU-like protein